MLKEKPRLLWQCLQTNTSSPLLLHWKWRQVFYGTSLFKLLSWAIMYFQNTQALSLFNNLTCLHFLQGFVVVVWAFCFVCGGFVLGVFVWFWVFGVVLVGWLGFLSQGSRNTTRPVTISLSMSMCFYANVLSGTWKPTQRCNIQVAPLINWGFLLCQITFWWVTGNRATKKSNTELAFNKSNSVAIISSSQWQHYRRRKPGCFHGINNWITKISLTDF